MELWFLTFQLVWNIFSNKYEVNRNEISLKQESIFQKQKGGPGLFHRFSTQRTIHIYNTECHPAHSVHTSTEKLLRTAPKYSKIITTPVCHRAKSDSQTEDEDEEYEDDDEYVAEWHDTYDNEDIDEDDFSDESENLERDFFYLEDDDVYD